MGVGLPFHTLGDDNDAVIAANVNNRNKSRPQHNEPKRINNSYLDAHGDDHALNTHKITRDRNISRPQPNVRAIDQDRTNRYDRDGNGRLDILDYAFFKLLKASGKKNKTRKTAFKKMGTTKRSTQR